MLRGVLVPLATTDVDDVEPEGERLTEPDAEGRWSLDDFPSVRTLGAFLAVLCGTLRLRFEDEAVGVADEYGDEGDFCDFPSSSGTSVRFRVDDMRVGTTIQTKYK